MHSVAVTPTNQPDPSELNSAVSDFIVSSDPVAVLKSWRESGFIERYIPELGACWGELGKQDPKWHPEGDVWTHTLKVVSGITHSKDIVLRLATLFHDIGKPSTMKVYDDGAISNHHHDMVGAQMFWKTIGPRLGLDNQQITDISWLIEKHMVMQVINIDDKVSPEARIEILKDPRINLLLDLHRADVTGTDLPPKLQRNNYDYCKALIARGFA